MRELDKGGGTQYTLFYRTFDEVAYFRVPKSVGTALKCFSDEKMQPSSKNYRKSMAMTCFVGLFTICTMKNKLTFGVSESTSSRRD